MSNSKRPLWEFELAVLVLPAICIFLLYVYMTWSNLLDFDYVQFVRSNKQKCYYVDVTKEIWDLQNGIQWGIYKGKNMDKEKIRFDFIMALNSKTTACVNLK